MNKLQYVQVLNSISAAASTYNTKLAPVIFVEEDIISITTNEQAGELSHINMQEETHDVSPKCDILYEFVKKHSIGKKLGPNDTIKISLDFCKSPKDIIEDLINDYNLNVEFVSMHEADILVTEPFRGPIATKFEEVSRISMFNAAPREIQEELATMYRGAYRNDLSQSIYSFETVDGTGSIVLHENAVPMFEFLLAHPDVQVLGLDNLYDYMNHEGSEINLMTDEDLADIIDTYSGIINSDNTIMLCKVLSNYDVSIEHNRHQIRKLLFAVNDNKLEIKKAFQDGIEKYKEMKNEFEYIRTNMYKVGRTIVNHSNYDISDMLKLFIVWFDDMETVARLFPEDRVKAIMDEYKRVGDKFEPVRLVDDGIEGYNDDILNDIVIEFVKKTLGSQLVNKVLEEFKKFGYEYILSQFAITFTFRDFRTKDSMIDVTWL